jgi:hypothetical protein
LKAFQEYQEWQEALWLERSQCDKQTLSFIDRFAILTVAALNLPEGAEPLGDDEPLPKLPVSFLPLLHDFSEFQDASIVCTGAK